MFVFHATHKAIQGTNDPYITVALIIILIIMIIGLIYGMIK